MAPVSGAISVCTQGDWRRTTQHLRQIGPIRARSQQLLARWHNTYQYAAPVTLDTSTEACPWDFGRSYDGNGSGHGARSSTCQRYLSLDAVGHRRSRHGDDRELSIWLDILRPRHPEEIRMGPRIDPVGIHPLRAVRDLAGADRGLVRR